MLWPRKDHPTGNSRSAATARDRKDNSYSHKTPPRPAAGPRPGWGRHGTPWSATVSSNQWDNGCHCFAAPALNASE